MVAVAIAGVVAGSVVSGVGSAIAGGEAASGAEKAAQTQAAAETQATNEEINQGNQAAQLQVPYEQYGTGAGNILSSELASGQLGAPAPLTQSAIEQMPGYQFTLQQGLMATQNAQAAQGLGVSGNALAAASTYATGLANQNFQNYFNDYWANQNNRYNMLYNMTQVGQNAATNAGNQMINVGGQVANTLTTSAANIGSAQATAASDLATGTSGAANAVASAPLNALLANSLIGASTSASTIGGGPYTNPGTASAAVPGWALSPQVSGE